LPGRGLRQKRLRAAASIVGAGAARQAATPRCAAGSPARAGRGLPWRRVSRDVRGWGSRHAWCSFVLALLMQKNPVWRRSRAPD